jgi:hypothetical protein
MPCRVLYLSLLLLPALFSTGCNSPYYADRGALFGGLTGAGVGALVGKATGNTGAGAVIGAGLGAITGSAVGASLDEIEARNRAEIEARLGRPVAAGAVTMDDVIAMTAAGVDEQVIVTHVQSNGVVRPLQTADLIFLKERGVSGRVIQAMQEPPRQVVVRQPPPVIVEEHYYGGPWGCYPRYHHHHHHRPRVGFGFSYHHHGH